LVLAGDWSFYGLLFLNNTVTFCIDSFAHTKKRRKNGPETQIVKLRFPGNFYNVQT